MGRAAQGRVGPVRRRVGDQPGINEPTGQFRQRHLGLHPRQRGPEAVVDAAAEAEVLVVTSVRVEPIRVTESAGVPAAGGEDPARRPTLWDDASIYPAAAPAVS